jgi:predicted nucleic acid-binding protein
LTDRVLVDSNVLIDILQEDEEWFSWSSARLAPLVDARRLVLDPIVYAEVSIAFASIEDLEAAIGGFGFERQPLPWEAGFLAGKAFERYRRRGGVKRSPLPDFYIGAHAAIAGLKLLTRDPRRYREYYPGLKLIAPE